MDLVSNALARIRNAIHVEKKDVPLRKNKTVLAIAEILKEEGFIQDVEEKDRDVVVTLSYGEDARRITKLERISSGGQRVYVSASELKPVYSGRGIGIISTSQGIMTAEKAREKGIGGEYICNIW